MRKIAKGSVFFNDDVDEVCLKPVEGGGCYFLKDGLCQVHAKYGPRAKPTGCQRFPYGLVTTPDGGRITTEHRCPCRTLGERPPLSVSDAESSLKDRAGRLDSDQELPARIPMTLSSRIGFARYLEIETGLLTRLAAGEDALKVLDATAFPDLIEGSWPEFAAGYFDMLDGTAGGAALVWFGDALMELTAGHRPPKRERPWVSAFERAIGRSKRTLDPESMFNDWIADEIWMFRWLEWEETFDVARAEMATRLTVARHLQKKIKRLGARADQAAAEAIMIAEIATTSSEWPKTIDDIDNDPSPAGVL